MIKGLQGACIFIAVVMIPALKLSSRFSLGLLSFSGMLQSKIIETIRKKYCDSEQEEGSVSRSEYQTITIPPFYRFAIFPFIQICSFCSMLSCISLTVAAGKNDATSLPFVQELKHMLENQPFYYLALLGTGQVGFLANQLGVVNLRSLLLAHLANTKSDESQKPLLYTETGENSPRVSV